MVACFVGGGICGWGRWGQFENETRRNENERDASFVSSSSSPPPSSFFPPPSPQPQNKTKKLNQLTQIPHQKHNPLQLLPIPIPFPFPQLPLHLPRRLRNDPSQQLPRLVSRDETSVVPVGVGDVDEGFGSVVEEGEDGCYSGLGLRVKRTNERREEGRGRRENVG